MMKKNDIKQTKLLHAILALLTAGTMLTACSSDDETPEPVKTYYMSVNATKQVGENSAQPKRALSLDGNKLDASWAKNEQVYVQGELASGETFWFQGCLTAQYAGTETLLNGALRLPEGWTISIDDAISNAHTMTLQFPRSGYFDYTGQKGTLADIAANYDYAIATNVRYDIKDDHIEGASEAVFENQQAIVKFTLKESDTDMLNPTALTVDCSSETIALSGISSDTYTTNGNGVLFVAIPGFSDQTVRLTATVGNDTYTFTKNHVTFEDGKYYEINVKMKKN